MTVTWTPTDVPAVRMEDLAMVMRLLVEHERGLTLYHGLDAADREQLHSAFWATYAGSMGEGHAILLRLDALVAVFSAQRLKQILLEGGFVIVWQAVAIAAGMRLNAEWGFNPQKFLWTLRRLEALSGVHSRNQHASPASHRQHATQPMAA